MRRVYLASCILIYLLEGPLDLRRHIRDAVLAQAEGILEPMVSLLTRLECRVGPLRREDHQLLAQYDALLASTDLRYIPLTAGVFDRATHLRSRHALKTPDALHLAAALQAECDELWTNDQRFAKVAGKELRIRVLG